MESHDLVMERRGQGSTVVADVPLIRRRLTVDRDADLVERLCRHEPGAIEALVAVYGDRVYRLAIGITGNHSDAEEVVQDALWATIRKIDTFRGTAAFGSGSTGSSPMPPTRSFATGQVDVAKSRSMRCCRRSTRAASM